MSQSNKISKLERMLESGLFRHRAAILVLFVLEQVFFG